MVKHVKPYPIDLLISNPSLNDLAKMPSRQRVSKIQVWLVACKSVQIPFTVLGFGPCGFVSHEVLPIIWWLIWINGVLWPEHIHIRSRIRVEVVTAFDAVRSGR